MKVSFVLLFLVILQTQLLCENTFKVSNDLKG